MSARPKSILEQATEALVGEAMGAGARLFDRALSNVEKEVKGHAKGIGRIRKTLRTRVESELGTLNETPAVEKVVIDAEFIEEASTKKGKR